MRDFPGYFIIAQSGKVLAGPFTHYVDAFNARAAIGSGTVIERPYCPHCGAHHERHEPEYPSHGLA